MEKAVNEEVEKGKKEHLFFRRDLLSWGAWAAIFLLLLSWLIAFLRFLFPRVLFEPSPIFKAGFPEEYPAGVVSDKFKKSHRVWIIREKEGFYALVAVCTHLGCTPNWLEVEGKFKCPCHGSGFTREGINYEGPAPRPLERVKIALAEDGQIVVDKSTTYRYEKGEWTKPGSFLRMEA